MRCPICGKDVKIDDPFMPFCSDRCRIIDLGNWASEKYVISAPAESPEASRGPTAPGSVVPPVSEKSAPPEEDNDET